MATGNTKLAFTSRSLAKENGLDFGQLGGRPSISPCELALVSADVEGSFAKAVAHGARELQKPVRKPWGQLVGYVRDGNGFLVEICSPLAD